MKARHLAVFIVAISLLITALIYIKAQETKKTEVVTFGLTEGQTKSFNAARSNVKKFFDELEFGEESHEKGDYEKAISHFNEALKHVRFTGESSMAYRRLADVYRDLGDKENELKYVRLARENAKNPTMKNEFKLRENEILGGIKED